MNGAISKVYDWEANGLLFFKYSRSDVVILSSCPSLRGLKDDSVVYLPCITFFLSPLLILA